MSFVSPTNPNIDHNIPEVCWERVVTMLCFSRVMENVLYDERENSATFSSDLLSPASKCREMLCFVGGCCDLAKFSARCLLRSGI